MVQFVGVKNVRDWIESQGLATVFRGLARYIEDDFRRWPVFEKAPRIANHSSLGVIELMPSSDGTLYSFKYVNGHPQNFVHSRQTVTAFGVLADVASGYPLLLSEMTILTALRTAATSALAAKYLARPNAKVMAIIGLGAQSEFQALAFNTLLGIKTLRIYDVDPAATQKFTANLARFGLDITVAPTAAEAVLGADIITTVTADKKKAVVLSDNMVGSGVHINAVGGDCPGKTELQRDILLRADVFVEYPEQTRVEGEIQQMEPTFAVTELWEVIAGHKQGRSSDRQITLFDSVGFATEDFSTLRFVRDQIQGTAFYSEIDLLAEPEDPRDLFGVLRGAVLERPEDRAAA